IAHSCEVVLEAVVHRGGRHLDELRVLVDHALEVVDIDPEFVRGLDDAHIESLLLQLEEMQQRALEVESIGHDVSFELAVELQRLHDQVFPGAGARHVRDLLRPRMDQLGELCPRAHGCRGSHSAAPFRGAPRRLQRDSGDRVRVGRVEVGGPRRDHEIGFAREAAHWQGSGRDLRQAHASTSQRRGCHEPAQPAYRFTSLHGHGLSSSAGMMWPKYDVTSRLSSRVSTHIMSRVTVGMVLATLGSGCTSVGVIPAGALKSGDLRYAAYNLPGAPL